MEVKTFPQALRICRKLNEWSQGDVGTAVGASQQAVASWESRRSSPRPETYTKLVEVFGADSLVAKCPPSEDDLLVPRAERFGYATPDPVRFNIPLKAAEPRAPYVSGPTPLEQRPLIHKISLALPEELAPGLGTTLLYRGAPYFATYQSERVCLVALPYRIGSLAVRRDTESPERLRSMIRAAVRRAAREVIHQLVVLRAINALAGPDHRSYIGTVTPHDTAIGFDGLMPAQAEDEAYLLGLRCYHAVTPEVVAAIIITGHEDPEQASMDFSEDLDD